MFQTVMIVIFCILVMAFAGILLYAAVDPKQKTV